tara:strand:+ start:722 stop:1036 length:315 start_codon:yes stop_codon:yes gene_type:complete
MNTNNLTFENINEFINIDIPKMNINHKLYIYETIGIILFNNKWDNLYKMFDTSSKEVNIKFLQVLQVINLYSIEQINYIINIIFQKILNLLINNPNNKNLYLKR